MLKKFYPDSYAESAYSIDFSQLYEKGYRGIIFDVDNTLVKHGAPATKKAVEFFEYLRDLGFDTCIISNNRRERVMPFAKKVDSPFISKAGKPSPKNYRKAMHIMRTDTTNTLFIGDQLFTDVWGANKAGVFSILVKPIDKHEEIQIVLKRILENIVLNFYFNDIRTGKIQEEKYDRH